MSWEIVSKKTVLVHVFSCAASVWRSHIMADGSRWRNKTGSQLKKACCNMSHMILLHMWEEPLKSLEMYNLALQLATITRQTFRLQSSVAEDRSKMQSQEKTISSKPWWINMMGISKETVTAWESVRISPYGPNTWGHLMSMKFLINDLFQ